MISFRVDKCINHTIRHTKIQKYLHKCKFFRTFASKIIYSFQIMTQNEIKQIRSLRLKKFRDEFSLFVAEGDKCISELSQSFTIVHHITSADTPKKEIVRLSSLQTPQGSIAVFRKPCYTLPEPAANTLYLALDGIQDPGNLGTIIRTADWFGIRDIICSSNTADCFSPKVVQATMGALARVRVHYTDLIQWISSCKNTDIPVYGTLLTGKNIYTPDAIPSKQSGIIVMGNEGNGISTAVRRLITHSLRIPSFPPDEPTSESLNVAIATAVILAEFRR